MHKKTVKNTAYVNQHLKSKNWVKYHTSHKNSPIITFVSFIFLWKNSKMVWNLANTFVTIKIKTFAQIQKMANNEPLRNIIISVTSGNTDGSCYHQNNGY